MGIKNIFNNFFKKNNKEEENILEKYAQNSEDDVIKNDDIINDIKEEAIESENDIDDIKEEAIESENDIDDIKEEAAESENDIDEIKKEAVESENNIDDIKEEIIENINNINDFMEPFGEVLSEKKEELFNIVEDNIDKLSKKSYISTNINIVDNNSADKNVEEHIEELLVEKKGLFARLKEGLKKTSDSFSSKFDNLFKGYLKIDDELYEELEEILITSDISFDTTLKIVENLKENIKKKNITDVNLVKIELKEVVYELLKDSNSKIDVENDKSVIIIVGVNGVGKTTTIGKLASRLKASGKSVLLAAGDTFRAAAEEQLEIWSKRAEVEIVRHQESGADPSAVIYDAIQKAKSKNIDVLICDTAGRLHNKVNLMNELSKIMRTVNKEHPDAKKEVLLVIDATTGQNALNQVKTFNEAVNLTGVILTKLDGTAKGGVILSIIDEYNIPVKFIGVGEKVDDLQEFNPRDFVDALFDNEK